MAAAARGLPAAGYVPAERAEKRRYAVVKPDRRYRNARPAQCYDLRTAAELEDVRHRAVRKRHAGNDNDVRAGDQPVLLPLRVVAGARFPFKYAQLPHASKLFAAVEVTDRRNNLSGALRLQRAEHVALVDLRRIKRNAESLHALAPVKPCVHRRAAERRERHIVRAKLRCKIAQRPPQPIGADGRVAVRLFPRERERGKPRAAFRFHICLIPPAHRHSDAQMRRNGRYKRFI